jgi:hypothetical protein
MADWKQIQARIRKAKNSTDPTTKLGELFAKTHDPMVAFETAIAAEKAERNEQALHWYGTAFEKFRRPEWKKKAEDGIVRLGGAVPDGAASPSETQPADPQLAPGEIAVAPAMTSEQPALDFSGSFSTHLPFEARETIDDPAVEGETQPGLAVTPAAQPAATAAGSRRRRGRRGGRGRSKGGVVKLPAPVEPAVNLPPVPARQMPTAGQAAAGQESRRAVTRGRTERRDRPERGVRPQRPAATEPVERPEPAEAGAGRRGTTADETPPPLIERSMHSRAGEPALASRLAHLEALLRRLVASPAHRLDAAEESPAGPGVFLLSDAELVTSYYVQACHAVRPALHNLARSGKSGSGGKRGHSGGAMDSVRANLAEHLGIGDAKVSEYLNRHCAIRWLQLDEEAPHVAHMAIAALRPALNVD